MIPRGLGSKICFATDFVHLHAVVHVAATLLTMRGKMKEKDQISHHSEICEHFCKWSFLLKF